MKALFLVFLPAVLFSQTIRISGHVLDDSTHEALPYATIRVDQTDIVTSSNRDGDFLLELPPGASTLLVTYVGYNPAVVKLPSPLPSSVSVALLPALIQMPEVAVAADQEDPALEIMRLAIRRREKNYAGLKNYDITGYRKDIFFKGSRIAMIEEKFIRHLYGSQRLEKEFVYSTHRTENIKSQKMTINLNVGWALFFINGTLNVGIGRARSQCVFPLADNALQYYDFKLLQTKFAGKNATHIIEVIPRTSLEPLIKGRIFIDDATCAVVGADVETNEGWHMPMVKGFRLKIQQTYANYNGYWIPQYSELAMEGQVSALGGLVSMDKMELSQVFSSSSCKVNGTIPDSLRLARRSKFGGYTTDTTKRVSSPKRTWKTKQAPREEDAVYEPSAPPPELTASAMNAMRPLPLTADERAAFLRLDSTQTLEKIFQPQGALGALAASSESGPGMMSLTFTAFRRYGMLHNNRVEGITPGVHGEIDDMEDDFYYGGSVSYSFGMKRFEGAANGGWNLADDHLDRIDANAWTGAQRWQTSAEISKTVNTLGFTLTAKDYFNYLRSTGFNLGVHKYFSDYTYVKLYMQAQRVRSAGGDQSFALSKRIRPNPSISEGKDHAVLLQWGVEPGSENRFGSWAAFSMQMNAAFSLPALGSEFDYQRYSATGTLKLNTFYSTMFSNPYLVFRLEGASVTGSRYGIQHLPSPSASLSVYSPFGVLKGVQQYELGGEQIVSVQAEHNWQALPLLALGWEKAGAGGLQFITGGSAANAWNAAPSYAINNTWKPYWEAYFSLGGIFDVLRIDCVRTSRRQTLIRFSIATQM
ncbi:MAG: DUF5686 family protein [Acidobacteriota bacterium]